MTDEVNKLIKKAEHALEVAEVLMKSDYPSDVPVKSITPCSMPRKLF
jgi:hypothetical protein